MNSDAAAPICVLLASLVLLGGCGDRQGVAYAKGWNEGYEAGVADGRTEGRAEAEAGHQGRWGVVGLAIGGMVGAGLVALATRRHLVTQWRRRRRRKEVERMVGHCKVDLDPDLHGEVVAIGRKKMVLRDRLEQDEGPLIGALTDRLRPELVRLDTKLLEIAALLQQLRDLRRETLPEGERGRVAKITRPPPLLGESKEAETLLALREQRRLEIMKNAENIARCENQLAGLSTFLDDLQMRLGNLKTIEQVDAFDRFEEEVGAEIDALAAAFETTLARLARGT